MHEIAVSDEETITQSVYPIVTEVKSSGMLVPVNEASRLLIVIVSTSASESI